MTALEPYRIDVPDDVFAGLAERLRRTRFPDEVPGIGWKHGPSSVTETGWTPRRIGAAFGGGHFPAMEVPDLFVQDVREFFRPLRP